MRKIGIVGGGLLGRLAAFILTESGHAVEVYEKTPENPDLSYFRAAAFTSAGLLSPISEKDSGGNIIFELGTKSLNLWSCLDRKIKKIIDEGLGLFLKGNLFVSSPAEVDMLHAYSIKLGLKGHHYLTTKKIQWNQTYLRNLLVGLFQMKVRYTLYAL